MYTLSLAYVPDHLKTQDMCDKIVEESPWSLEYVPNWFVTQQQIKLWHDNIIAMMIGLLNGIKVIEN